MCVSMFVCVCVFVNSFTCKIKIPIKNYTGITVCSTPTETERLRLFISIFQQLYSVLWRQKNHKESQLHMLVFMN